MLFGHANDASVTADLGQERGRVGKQKRVVFMKSEQKLKIKYQPRTKQQGKHTQTHTHTFPMLSPLSPWACRNQAGVPSCRRQWSWGTSRDQPGQWRWWPWRISHRSWSSLGRHRGCLACSPPKGAEADRENRTEDDLTQYVREMKTRLEQKLQKNEKKNFFYTVLLFNLEWKIHLNKYTSLW